MIRALVIVFAVLAGGCVGWTKANTAAEAAFITEQVVDYRQTSEAVVYGAEGNVMIGAHGQNISPAAWFLTTTLIHVALAAALPRYWRETFQGATLLSQGVNVYGNVDALRRNRGCLARVGTSKPCFSASELSSSELNPALAARDVWIAKHGVRL